MKIQSPPIELQNPLIQHCDIFFNNWWEFIMLAWIEIIWIGFECIACLTSHSTIFQLYIWRHIDVQANWRSWTYGRDSTPLTFRRVLKRASPSTDTGPTFLRLLQKTVPFQSPFTTRKGIRRTYLHLKPFGSPRGSLFKSFLIYDINLNVFLFIILKMFSYLLYYFRHWSTIKYFLDKPSWVIRCTRYRRLTWPLILNSDPLTWISIGIK